MECEVCGKETGKGKLIVIDGNTMVACTSCASFGKEKQAEEKNQPMMRTTKLAFKEKQLDLGLDIVEDYGKRIRQAREIKEMTVKELAMKIFEKESLLHRLENQAIKPSDEIIKKLEKQLGIKLKQKE